MSDGDAVRRALPEDMEVVMKQVVRVETRADKWEERIAVVSDRRVYIISVAKAAGKSKKSGHSKIEQSFHLLHVSHIVSHELSRVMLTVKGRQITMEMMSQTAVDQLIALMLIEIEGHLPVNAGAINLDVQPEERENALLLSAERELKVVQQNIGPCGGFVKSYRFLCDYFELPIREDVAWQIDAVYRGANKKTLELRDFAHMAPGDMLPLIAALCFNDFFTALDCGQVKLTPECQERLSFVFRKNTALKSISLEGAGLKGDGTFQKMIAALAGNERLMIEHADFSNNHLDDKGVQMCASWLESTKHPLTSLNLSSTKCSSKGANAVGRALTENKAMAPSLKRLNLSDNNLGSDGFGDLGRFVLHSSLEVLEMQGTAVLSDAVLQCLADGVVSQTISRINLADNRVSHPRRGRLELPKSVIKMFHTTSTLQYLNVSNSKFPVELLRGVLQGLQDNGDVKEIELVLSGNEFGSNSLGAALNDCGSALKRISKLDISNNDLENDIIAVCAALRSCQTVRDLSLGGNFGKSGKVQPQTLQAIGNLIADSQAGLEVLSLADSRIRAGIGVILRALISEDVKLKNLDIRGNLMGDVGAHILAKVLQVNTSLHTVLWDRNGTTQVGFRHVAFALESNYSLLTMPLPLTDGAAVLSPETEMLLQRMQELVTRNHSPKSQPEKKKAHRQNVISTSVAAEDRLDHLVSLSQDKVNLLHSHRKHADIKEAIARHEVLMDACNQASELMSNFDIVEVQHDAILSSLKQSLSDTDFTPLTGLLKAYPGAFVELARTNVGDSVDEEMAEHLKELADKHATLDTSTILQIIHSEASHGFASAMNDVVYSVAQKVWVGVLNAMVGIMAKWNDELYTLVTASKGRPTSPNPAEKSVNFAANGDSAEEEGDRLSLSVRQRKLRRSRPPTIAMDEEFDPLVHGNVDATPANAVSPSRMAIFPEFRDKMAVLLAEAEQDSGTEDGEGPDLSTLGTPNTPRKSVDKEPAAATAAAPSSKIGLPGFLRKKDKSAQKDKSRKPSLSDAEKEKPEKAEKSEKADKPKRPTVPDVAVDLPDLAPSTGALTHVTKGRAAPKRTNRARPQRKPQDFTDRAQSANDLFAVSAPEPDIEEEGSEKMAGKGADETDAEVAAVTAMMPPLKHTSSSSPARDTSSSPVKDTSSSSAKDTSSSPSSESPILRSSPIVSGGLSASVFGELKKKKISMDDDSPKPKPRSGSDASISKSKSSSSLAPDSLEKPASGKSSADTSPKAKPRSPRPAVKSKPKKPVPRPGEDSDDKSASTTDLSVKPSAAESDAKSTTSTDGPLKATTADQEETEAPGPETTKEETNDVSMAAGKGDEKPTEENSKPTAVAAGVNGDKDASDALGDSIDGKSVGVSKSDQLKPDGEEELEVTESSIIV